MARSKKQLKEIYAQVALDFELDVYSIGHLLFPRNRRVLDSLATTCSTAGQFDRAYKYVKRLVDRYPSNSRYRYNLACSLCTIGRVQDALKALGDAVAHGFRDFEYMTKDSDLKELHEHPLFREYHKKALVQRSARLASKE
ncbi:MAG: tetratricopeptide repeat protein [Planctomycetes bacterium]|nr:tetratricopeptide repeat protein [Planctomycetota bacterium]